MLSYSRSLSSPIPEILSDRRSRLPPYGTAVAPSRARLPTAGDSSQFYQFSADDLAAVVDDCPRGHRELAG